MLELGTISQIRTAYLAKKLSIVEATQWYIRRIERFNAIGPAINAVKCVSPHALDDAMALDKRLAAGSDLGPLHGIPLLVKANVMMGEQFTVHAGVAAFKQFRPKVTAYMVNRLRAAGAIILGQTNLTEFADYVSDHMPAEFSGAEGAVKNPHGISYGRGQGSSVGSAAAVAAGMAPLAIGGETQNSIQTPASYSSVVGLKPSVGAICRAGIMPLVPSQDAPGFLGRCLRDVQIATEAVAGADPRDLASMDLVLARHARPAHRPTSLADVRVGVPRRAMAERDQFAGVMPIFQATLDALAKAGATIVDPCDLPSAEQMQDVRSTVFATEFKASLNSFLEEHGVPGGIGSLRELIAWNERHKDTIPYGQSLLLNAEETLGLNHPKYIGDRTRDIILSRTTGIDAALAGHDVDVLIAPMGCAAKCTGKAGAPTLAIPVGLDPQGTPFGVTLYTSRGGDRQLLSVGALIEQAIADRRAPQL
jgi:amidase